MDSERWVSGAALERREWRNDKGIIYKPSNVSRRLRDLENDAVTESKLQNGHVWYRLKKEAHKPKIVAWETVTVDGYEMARPIYR